MGVSDESDGLQKSITAVLRLEPRADAAAIARRFVQDNRDSLDPAVIGNAELLVSELVTNAVRHGRGEITLTVRVEPPGIGVAVTDGGYALPVMPSEPPAHHEPSGRGLLIVDAMSSRWGVTDRATSGKTVWFDLHADR